MAIQLERLTPTNFSGCSKSYRGEEADGLLNKIKSSKKASEMKKKFGEIRKSSKDNKTLKKR